MLSFALLAADLYLWLKKFDRIDKPDFFKQRAADGLSIRFFLNQRASNLQQYI